jgi:toxin-antitoxin system PIN domain toxin
LSVTVDTNVLVYASNPRVPENERASALLAHLAAGPALVVLLWPTLISYVRLVTGSFVYPQPLTHAEAVANVGSLLDRSHVRAVGESDAFWETYQRVAEPVAPRGNLVSDAHLVALMHQHGVSRIWSRDRDLRKFDGITVTDPFAARYRSGFGKP